MQFDFESKTVLLSVSDREVLATPQNLYFSDEVLQLYGEAVNKHEMLCSKVDRINADKIGRTGELRNAMESQQKNEKLVKDLRTVAAYLHPELFPPVDPVTK